MGRKVNPIVFRIGTTRTWSAKWHAGDKEFKQFLMEDLKLRKTVSSKYGDAAISNIDIERGAEDKITITLHTARPGMVIGRGGSRVEEIRKTLNDAVGDAKKVQLNIKEI
ncbi:MAG: KH domain-containing protein, partial [Chloroflexi bacterium]|nr:KH domain-containing protein [Chloroflexota bacterium]